jgi:hypothetical protein
MKWVATEEKQEDEEGIGEIVSSGVSGRFNDLNT